MVAPRRPSGALWGGDGGRRRPVRMSLTRIAGVLPFVAHLGRLGAPVERYLREARIPVALLERPDAALPLEQAYRFGEIACRSEGIAHLGVWVGLETSLGDLGPYGRALEDSLTVYEYLSQGNPADRNDHDRRPLLVDRARARAALPLPRPRALSASASIRPASTR